MSNLVGDCEVYKDYFLLMLKDIDNGNTHAFEMYDGKPLDVKNVQRILKQHTVITFNGNNFDMPLIDFALKGASCVDIKAKSDQIITEDKRYWEIGLSQPECDHIDLIEVAPGFCSLKVYGGRMHCPTMQDLPIEPNASITPAQREELKTYCLNDLDITERLYRTLTKQIDLRRRMSDEYGIDLRSKSDAQIAEAVIYQSITMAREGDAPPKKAKAPKSFKYDVPSFIHHPVAAFVASCEFTVAASGAPECEALEDHKLTIGNTEYRMGIGGLHSSEKSISHHADDTTLLIDRDVASYYPSIIRVCELYPSHLGREFLNVYGGFIDARLDAKHRGDKTVADTYKIFLNGTYGKLGSKYSCLYAPKLLIQVALTGQLALLMLIQAIEDAGIRVVSANTDGIVIKCPTKRLNELNQIVWYWEFITGFETEETRYSAVYSRDVNNYLAVKTNGEVKTKGVLTGNGLTKSPAGEIISEAVIAHLTTGADIDETIRGCQDIRKFLTVRTVTGGGVDQQGTYLGKAVRWYYGKGVIGGLRGVKRGNKVGSSEGAVPCMRLPDQLPDDIDYDVYIAAAKKLLKGLT